MGHHSGWSPSLSATSATAASVPPEAAERATCLPGMCCCSWAVRAALGLQGQGFLPCLLAAFKVSLGVHS